MNPYQVQEMKDLLAGSLGRLEQSCFDLFRSNEGISKAEQFAKEHFEPSKNHVNRAYACYSSVMLSRNIFCHWWQENVGNDNFPIVDDMTWQRIAATCSKCSPKDATGAGAGAGALGGLFVGGLVGAVVGGIAGAFGGYKLSEEATGQKYDAILKEAIHYLFTYLYSEICKQIDYSNR